MEINEDKKVRLEEARRQENQTLLKQILDGQASFNLSKLGCIM